MISKISSRSIMVVMMAIVLSACGGKGSGNTTVVTAESNTAPVAGFLIVEIAEDSVYEFTLPSVDGDGDTLTFTAVSQPNNGSVEIAGAEATYTPTENFNGQDSFNFKVNDGAADSNIATVTINIAAVNDAPEAVALSANTNEDVAVEVTLLATDAESDTLTYFVVTPPTSGSLGAISGNKVTYTPLENTNGGDSFSFSTNDGKRDSNTVTVTIAIAAVSDAPEAVAVSTTTNEDTAVEVTLSGIDADNDTLTYEVVTLPISGSLGTVVGNKVIYTPAENTNGDDRFSFKVNDGSADSGAAEATITVVPVNDAPLASALTVEAIEDIAIEITLPASDAFDNDSLTFTAVSQPENGSVAIAGDKATYTSAENFNGQDSFSFLANDGSVDSNIAIVTINVEAVNDAPVADVVNVKTDEGTVVEVTLKARDVDSDSLVYSIVDQPQDGLLSSVIGNTVTYTPVAAFSGVESFTYRANDGEKDSEVMTVSVAMGNVVAPIVQLTDTGITLCRNGNGVESSCPVTNYPGQDAQYGRDVDNNDDSDGHAGFSYTKLDANGKDLPASADSWSCVKDNVTGLIWEVKQDKNWIVGENLHDADDRYTWYSTDNNTNNGFVGFQRYQPIWYADYYKACYGYDSAIPSSYCNTEAFVDRVNQAGLCGANDWRLPSIAALRSLINYDELSGGHAHLDIDRAYFPQTQGSLLYRSSSSYAGDSYRAWSVSFNLYNEASYVRSSAIGKSNDFYVRLVRGGIDRR